MARVEVSIGFIRRDGTYLMQRRPNSKTVGAAGLIGLFGGTIEQGETPIEAVCRELGEETSLELSPEDFSYLGHVSVTAYKADQPLAVEAEVFLTEVPTNCEVVALEGELIDMSRDEARARVAELSPATVAAFEQFL